VIGIGVLPLPFKDGTDRKSRKLDGSERFDILGISRAAAFAASTPSMSSNTSATAGSRSMSCGI